IFAMLGAIMFSSKQLLEFLPNVELVSTLTMVYTLVYRKCALIPIFLFILMEGLLHGFSTWWLPYFYLWPSLWGITMLLPKRLPRRLQTPVYAVTCGLFGLAYGSLYAPFQAVVFLNCDYRATLNWIVAGLPWDVVHAEGNLAMGLLIVPLADLLRKLEARLSGSSVPS
ncbi:MAG: hypothetical protein IIY70_03575, partial [Oscillospiraceae bacterium]|nr:hypothetical protein [Oscillospiraceae bacterium]